MPKLQKLLNILYRHEPGKALDFGSFLSEFLYFESIYGAKWFGNSGALLDIFVFLPHRPGLSQNVP